MYENFNIKIVIMFKVIRGHNFILFKILFCLILRLFCRYKALQTLGHSFKLDKDCFVFSVGST